ncbi:hypothetical protein C7212DRAFT_314678 [Tuber magnatum]|uniref:Uncharacterized protein n=1 Tax=Tuber magnatum TaxID=42249 RepID=A0A317SWP4_9PEZI|nr:hypothetical protein C7212DRAFT_314678 [Tuber magnatum]
MLRLFTKKQGFCFVSRQIIHRSPRRFIVTGNKNGSPEHKADKNGAPNQQKGNGDDGYLWNRVEKLDDRISDITKEHNDFKVDVSKGLVELKAVIEKGFGEIEKTRSETLLEIEKTRTDIQKTRSETLTEVEKFRAQSRTIQWQVAVLLTGSGLVIAFIVEEYLRANLHLEQTPPSPAADLSGPGPVAKPAIARPPIAR